MTLSLADEVAKLDQNRTDANTKMVAAYEEIRTLTDQAINGSTQGQQSAAASAIIGHTANLWIQGIRLAALAANGPGVVTAAVISDMDKQQP